MKPPFPVLLLFGLLPLLMRGQDCGQALRVRDASDQSALAFATVTYRVGGGNMEVGFTDGDGMYKCILPNGESVAFRVTYFGYGAAEFSLRCTGGIFEVAMSQTAFELQEVVVTERLPQVVQKRDTVIYDVSQFANGQEWKLREILAKLPGIEVTRNNEVLYQGERVEEVLVEGQTFFTGDASLAVRYIPADAVDKVQVLEKYNEVASLAGSGVNDKLALNIQLKPARKKLLFGDLLAGTDIRARHSLHANLFRYLPRTSINHISDANTTGQAALSDVEMFRLVGLKINGYDPRSGIEDGLEDLPTLTTPTWASDRQALFTITQLRQQLPKNTVFTALFMWTGKNERAEVGSTTDYLAAATQEIMQQSSANQTGRLMAKATLATDHKKPNRIAYDFHYVRGTQGRTSEADVLLNGQTSRSAAQRNGQNTVMRHDVTAILRLSEHWQSILQARLRHDQDDTNGTWYVGGGWRPTFFGSDADTFMLGQTLRHRAIGYSLLWRLNRTLGAGSRAYFFVRRGGTVGVAGADATFSSGGTVRDLDDLGIGYDQRMGTGDWMAGKRFLLRKRATELQVGMDYLLQRWYSPVFTSQRVRESRPAPVLELATLIPRVGRLRLSYGYDVAIPQQMHLFHGLQVRDFNRLLWGNPALSASRSHNVGLHFSKSNLLRGRVLSAGATYLRTGNPLLLDYSPWQNVIVENFTNGAFHREDFIGTVGAQWYKKKLRITSRTRFFYVRFRQDYVGGAALLRQRSVQHTISMALEVARTSIDVSSTLSVGHPPTEGHAEDWFWDNQLSLSLNQQFGERWKADFSASLNHVYASDVQNANSNLSCGLQYATPRNRYVVALRAYNILNQGFMPEIRSTAFLYQRVLHATIPGFAMVSVTRVF